MGITLRELRPRLEKMEMKIVAGEKGLDRKVLWTHMVGSIEISAFVQKGELAFTTGAALKKGGLLELVKDVYAHGGCGMVINIGPYIKEIDQSVIDFAEKHDFSVFEVPWKIHMANLTRFICFEIFNEQKNSETISSAINQAIYYPERTEMYLPVLQKYGISQNTPVRAVLIQHSCYDGIPYKERTELLFDQLKAHIKIQGYNIFLMASERTWVLLVPGQDEAEISEIFYETADYMKEKTSSREYMVICTGNMVMSADKFHSSYETAEKMLRLLQRFVNSDEQSPAYIVSKKTGSVYVSEYSKLGFYRILLSITDTKVLLDYSADTIKPLADYDEIHGTSLCKTLKTWLFTGCSLQNAADELHIHRNTVHYQIMKAQEILGVDMTDPLKRMEIAAGLITAEIVLWYKEN